MMGRPLLRRLFRTADALLVAVGVLMLAFVVFGVLALLLGGWEAVAVVGLAALASVVGLRRWIG